MTASSLSVLDPSAALAAVQPTRDELRRWYVLMHLGRVLDDKAPNYLKQGLGWSYHAPCAGHDGIQVALGTTFRPRLDYLFPYYRDLTTCLSAGITPEQILLNGMSKATDVASGGRHMSNHFANHDLFVFNVSSSVANHAQHAAGLGRAIRSFRMQSVVFCSMGESSTSEGYYYEAVNGCSVNKLPVVFVIQDNGYGISVPKRQQTANRLSSDNFSSFPNLRVVHCDGKDVLDSVRAMREAVGRVRQDPLPLELRPPRAVPVAGGARGGPGPGPAPPLPPAPPRGRRLHRARARRPRGGEHRDLRGRRRPGPLGPRS
jgi:2-oxoisovalerate dehydrogenase E1 component